MKGMNIRGYPLSRGGILKVIIPLRRHNPPNIGRPGESQFAQEASSHPQRRQRQCGCSTCTAASSSRSKDTLRRRWNGLEGRESSDRAANPPRPGRLCVTPIGAGLAAPKPEAEKCRYLWYRFFRLSSVQTVFFFIYFFFSLRYCNITEPDTVLLWCLSIRTYVA